MAQAIKIVLRVQSCSGRFVVNGLSRDSTLWDIHKVLQDKTSIPPDRQKILCGYPPKELPNYNPQSTLESLLIKSGDTLTLEELNSDKQLSLESTKPTVALTTTTLPHTATTSITASTDLTSHSFNSTKHVTVGSKGQITGASISSVDSRVSGTKRELDYASGVEPCNSHKRSGKLMRKVVPADNSCLFKTISILLCNSADSNTELRELAAGIIVSNPDKYSSVILGRTNTEYTRWLLNMGSWGGGIELTVFSEHFKVELDVVDIQSQRVDRFGENKNFERRALLLYDGIHYDPLVMADGDGNVLQTTFPLSNEAVLFEALEIASQANKARQYTDITGFSLRCLVCGTALTGQADAQTHAQKTGHINFGEV